ncbi:MAG: NYN domain-containing protein [Cereibacter sphaeroides]|uniref:NYN domain-containing protein n=1 Tax=Cereibacter sphaeroides TaxID=1063 RepID=A0A2W5TPV5_CERSP|nr:MAG: NYN domain-containing protein [Cereibacter sphaeroides]
MLQEWKFHTAGTKAVVAGGLMTSDEVGKTRAGRVALLIDGENISQDLAGQIIVRSSQLGSLVVKRVYGNVAKMPKWDAAPGFKLVHSGSGKNATDMLLTVEAMKLSYEETFDTIAIVSSDGDFSHLAHDLRERQITVVGIGRARDDNKFHKACSRYIDLGQPESAVAAEPKPQPRMDELSQKVVALIRSEGGVAGYPIGKLGGRMHADYKVKIYEYPEKTWRAYLVARPHLFVCDPKGPDAKVRLRASAH